MLVDNLRKCSYRDDARQDQQALQTEIHDLGDVHFTATRYAAPECLSGEACTANRLRVVAQRTSRPVFAGVDSQV